MIDKFNLRLPEIHKKQAILLKNNIKSKNKMIITGSKAVQNSNRTNSNQKGLEFQKTSTVFALGQAPTRQRGIVKAQHPQVVQ